jgi:hypothetical protein
MNDEIKEDEMGRASSSHGRERKKHVGFWWGKQNERGH